MDIWDKEKRSAVMAKIRGKDTKPEWIVRRYLFAHGYRYRKNVKSLPGTPDIVLRKYGLVIFVHGCFWHGHGDSHIPHSRIEYWTNKIEANKKRDQRDKAELLRMGWNVPCRQGTDAERDGISHQPVLFGSPPQKSRTKSTASQEHPSCR